MRTPISKRNIVVKGAREHNLKGIDLTIPRDRLVVVSGVSGSGKSSLVFDTIFAEGQRRYVESLSAYARQFLGQVQKPKLDYIEGLSPSIAIEQKTTHKNPRSTVGTVTEIYDYLRLLYARVGIPHCPHCGSEIQEQSIDEIVESVLGMGPRVVVLAPIVCGQKGQHKKILEDAKRSGFARIRIDGEILNLEEPPLLEKNLKHTIEVVVDRIQVSPETRKRLSDSLETAIELSGGQVVIQDLQRQEERFFSEKNACSDCGFSMSELEPRLFSFNSPYGACQECNGLGFLTSFDRKKIMPDPKLSFDEGGLKPYNPEAPYYQKLFGRVAEALSFSLSQPLGRLSPATLDKLFDGSGSSGSFREFPGLIADLKRRYRGTTSGSIREWLEGFMEKKSCRLCQGKRLKPESLAVTVGGKSIYGVTALSVKEAKVFLEKLKLSATGTQIAEEILKEVKNRLTFMSNVGLEYLTLERAAGTLSGGEAQRIRLATQIGAALVGVLYVLDEPTIGLHQRDNERLIRTLLHLRDLGNTLLVVEHDEQTLQQADYLVDIGPGAGVHGGQVISCGSLKEVLADKKSLTGRFLSGAERIEVPQKRRGRASTFLSVTGVRKHNLKDFSVEIPLGRMNVITGVSGSGKSTLLTNVLYPILLGHLQGKPVEEGLYKTCDGLDEIDKVICIDQSPIGRTPRSNPATYVGLFTPIRAFFAVLPEARMRGYKAGRFSFNVKGGRCEKCQGAGTKRIEMHFLADVYVVCDVCKGKRFNRETLEVRYRGKSIHDILELSVEDALDHFSEISAVAHRLRTLQSVGLGYIKLGQSALTLSGGEAQRVKLAFELSKRGTGKTFYIIDEPTTGLHFFDVKKLVTVLHKLVDKGNTICMIEHNMDVIKQADHLIDLGPEGGDEGGKVVALGTPEEVANSARSYTGRFLKEALTPK